ncbi:MAG: glutaredoxin family protein [Rhodanobacteraceae bacterium]
MKYLGWIAVMLWVLWLIPGGGEDTGLPAGFHATPGANEVVILTQAGCRYCDAAERLLDKTHVSYDDFDVNHSDKGRRMFHQLHGHGVPVLVINKQVIHGYSRSRILAALK